MGGSGAFLTFSPDAFTTTDLTAGLWMGGRTGDRR